MLGDDNEDAVEFELDGIRFVSSFIDQAAPDRFTLMKPAAHVAAYARVLDEFVRPRMIELGLAYGGSLAWFALRARPARLVGIEYKPDRIAHLDDFVRARDLGAVVRAYFGVDQADGDRLREIVAAEFGDEPIDLVVDDASHLYGPTLASFETLFPRVRPGGLYLIEDWAGLHQIAARLGRMLAEAPAQEAERLAARLAERIESGDGATTPLSRLVIEFTLAQVSETRLIDDLSVNRHWIAVRRGPVPLPETGFRLADHYDDVFDMVRPLRPEDLEPTSVAPR
jgi:predicted O-methyltransferase YrrM